jgi:hypothetical protein
MKTILSLMTVSVAMMVALSGCVKDTMRYEGEAGVYFAVQRGSVFNSEFYYFFPTTTVDFVTLPEGTTQESVKIRVRMTGDVVDYPREFIYEIDPLATTATEGIDYTAPSGIGVIPAGERDGYAEFTVYRTEAMREGALDICLRLLPNDNFSLAFTSFDQPNGSQGLNEDMPPSNFDATKHLVIANDRMVQPAVWYGNLSASGAEQLFFGIFSVKKMELLLQVSGFAYTDFMSSGTMSYDLSGLVGKRLAAYLVEQYRNGTPVLEADGRLMWVDGVKWVSYPGTPWDGVINPAI